MRITIVGGGFGGIKAALELVKNPRNRVTLISDKTDFQYYPALYSTATGRSHMQSWVPLGEIFAGKNVRVVIDAVTEIDKATHRLRGRSGKTYDYDACILAIGSVTTFFGIKGLDTYSYGIKSKDEIMKLKRHLHDSLVEDSVLDKHYVVIGAGPTGIELSSALVGYLKKLKKRYRDKGRVIVNLVEAAPRILPKMSERSSELIHERLKKIGVAVHTGTAVEGETEDALILGDERIESKTIVWTSGVANHPFYMANASQFDFAPNGRVAVNKYMSSGDDVYVIGDNAAMPYCGLAQTAMFDGLFVARHLDRISKRKKLVAYRQKNPPVVIPVGSNWALVEWGSFRVTGIAGSLIRKAADFIGYKDMLDFGQAVDVWYSQRIEEEDYFGPKLAESA